MLDTGIRDGVVTLTLARAARGNALSPALVEALLAAVDGACADDTVHTMVLRAEGRHFCTGFDLSDLDDCSDGDLLARFVRIEALLAALWHAPVHTVAVAQGRAWGAGADLFAACETRIAAADASFRFPGAGFGLVLGSRRLAERVGADTARRWVIEGAQVDAAQALGAGLASAMMPSVGGAAMPSAGDTMMPSAGDAAVPVPPFPAPAVSRATAAAIRTATRTDHRDTDLAALVRSAATPGLRARIAAYRDALRQAPRATPQ